MNQDLIRAVTMAVLRDHYKAAATWTPMGDRNGKGWWACACGVRGEPIGRNLTDGHRTHIADLMAAALCPTEETTP